MLLCRADEYQLIDMAMRMKHWSLALALIVLGVASAVAQDTPRRFSLLSGFGSEVSGLSIGFEYRMPISTSGSSVGFKSSLGWSWQTAPTRYRPSNNLSTYQTHYTAEPDPDARTVYPITRGFAEYSVGLEANVLLGRDENFLELGIGTALDLFDVGVNFYDHRKALGETPTLDEIRSVKPSRLAHRYYGKAGYRYVSPSGFVFGVGASLMRVEGLFTYFYADPKFFTPYLMFGYSF